MVFRWLVIQFTLNIAKNSVSAGRFSARMQSEDCIDTGKNRYWLPVCKMVLIQSRFPFNKSSQRKQWDPMKTSNAHTHKILQEYLNFWTWDHKVINRRIPALRTHNGTKHIHITVNEITNCWFWWMEMQRCSSSPNCFWDIYFDSESLNAWRYFSVFLSFSLADFMQNHTLWMRKEFNSIHTSAVYTYLKRMISYNALWRSLYCTSEDLTIVSNMVCIFFFNEIQHASFFCTRKS